jgi:hypothetical protein
MERIGLDRVSRSERHQGDREKSKKPSLSVDPPSPTETQRRKPNREGYHRHLKRLTRQKREAQEGERRKTKGQRQTVYGTGKRDHRTNTIDVV